MKISVNHNKLDRRGMSLVEIILAMAILSIVVILMTPVMLNAFSMITLSGDRHGISKDVAAQVEDGLAGETITETLADVSIDLPGGISVGGKAYEINQGSDARYVDLFGYIINSMAVIDPTGTTTAATGETTVDPTAVTMPSTSAAIELKDVTADVSLWRNDDSGVNKYGTLYNTTTQMEYQITYLETAVLYKDWTTCSNSSTAIYLPDNSVGYLVVVRQRDNIANNKHMRIRSKPDIAFHKVNALQTSFYIYDTTTFSWRAIITSDAIELILTPSDTWTAIATGKKIKNLDTSYVYARQAASASYDEGGTTIEDPASFPAKVTNYQ